ncbi:MAG: CBS domain-containing protein [Candidatus Rokubacteria bacterium]|nr:CBS domain-containing protein [Candidatus Rokubacteria bacterium]
MNIAAILATKGSRVVTVQPEHTIRQALRLLADHNIGALVVVDGQDAPVGILSERDIVRAAARDEDLFGELVSALMTRDLVIGTPQDDLAAVGRTMTERRIRHVPIVEGGRLVGMISIGDVMKAQRDQYQGEVDTLQAQILENTA